MRSSDQNCPDCGPNFVNHRVQRSLARLDVTLTSLTQVSTFIWRGVGNFFGYIRFEQGLPYLFKGLSKLGVGAIVTSHKHETDSRSKVFWQEAEKRGITMYKFAILKSPSAKGIFVAEHNGQVTVFDILPRPKSSHSPSVAWMDDKGVMRTKFAPQNIPIARGGFAETEKEALALFEKIGGTVIVKPRSGSRSRHTTIHITTREQLIKAFWVAKELSPWVVVEEELHGYVHRVTLVQGKVVGVMRREPPHVVGDGVSMVRQLVEKENLNPARQGPLFHLLAIDDEAIAELAHQGYAPESVPPAGKLTALGQKVGRGSGGSTTDFTNVLHPENKELFERIGAFMADPLVGVDFIIEDMRKPWSEQLPCGVIECNSLPFIDLHHYPLYGEVVNAAGALWDSVFPGSGR